MSIVQQVVATLLAAIGALIASFVMTGIRNIVTNKVINGAFSIVATPFYSLAIGSDYLAFGLGKLSDWLKRGLAKGANDVGAWDVFGPLFFLLFLAVLVAGDAYFAILTFPELFHTPQPSINPAYFAPLSSVLWVIIGFTLVGIAFDLFGLTHFLRPYEDATGQVQRMLRIGVLVSLGLLALAAILFGLFRALLVDLTSVGFVDTSLNVLLFLLITVAAAGASVSLWYGSISALLILCVTLGFLARGSTFSFRVPVGLLDRIADLTVGAYDVPSGVGQLVWDWLARVSKNTRLQLGEVPKKVDREHLPDILQVFFQDIIKRIARATP